MNIVFSAKSLVYLSLVCSLLTLLFSGNRFIKSIRFICGLTMLIATVTALSPVIKNIGNLTNIDFNVSEGENTDSKVNDLIINQSASYICEYVKSLIEQKYSIPGENVSVSVTLDTDDPESIKIKNVTLNFTKTDSTLYPEISGYVSDALGCECSVISK